ncbi:uncharacterized protein ACA1_233070 [Acanthamoeba castellanii str. Neff]|uniref:Uncharacterized protein n=1 Tax=Acanthamoeba castellanii (strain ATCC 30010 / Neff) TaxID=1257118 RepID=L8H091_ACACF|nr:uncharacterized protein ACA1_233070 [Acanthamoeba castellanii str. Neff]ELR18939.1 hypothetical protein ACA1_233070 [Acanthamoeba castellanii str. Neff]
MEGHHSGITLPAAFAEAWKRQRSLDAGAGGKAEEVFGAWERCNALLQPALPALFSRNERLDDFNTSTLKYLLVPYYLGGALAQLPALAKRAHHLKRAQACFSAFLAELERHEGLTREDLNVWHRETQLQPTARRTERINRARRERELQLALQELHQRRGISALAGHDEEDEEHADEEVEREIWLNTIQLAVSCRLLRECPFRRQRTSWMPRGSSRRDPGPRRKTPRFQARRPSGSVSNGRCSVPRGTCPR